MTSYDPVRRCEFCLDEVHQEEVAAGGGIQEEGFRQTITFHYHPALIIHTECAGRLIRLLCRQVNHGLLGPRV